jgi:nucleotide-binding universal stress UspA family protein
MKTILIATDFSDASRNASFYGRQLGRALNANIILFNAYNIPNSAPGFGVTVSRYDVMMKAEKRLLDEADFLEPKKQLIEIACDEGNAEDAIINIANEKKADFIITGMKGSGKNLKNIFGSTATALARKTKIPLIIVPEDALYKDPETIVLATDAAEPDKDIPYQLTAITQFFNSKLYVVKVVKNKNEEWYQLSDTSQQPGKNSQATNISLQPPANSDLQQVLNEFIETHHADMLVMTPHKHEWLERLFKKSETKDMIFHTQIPLLVLPET